MRGIVFLVVVGVFLTGLTACGDLKEDSFESRFKEYAEKNMDDPKSYEAVETKFFDSLTVREFAEMSLYKITSQMELDSIELENYALRMEGAKPEFIIKMEPVINNYKESLRKNDSILKTYAKVLNDSSVIYLGYEHSFRINENGNPKLQKYYVLTDPHGNIKVAGNQDQMEELMLKEYRDFAKANNLQLHL